MTEPGPKSKTHTTDAAIVLKTRFTRSNSCRVIHVDGAWGSVTPGSNIHMALFTERWPVPDATEVKPDEKNVLRDVAMAPTEHVHREIEVEALMSLQTAQFLKDWLDEKLRQARAMGGQE